MNETAGLGARGELAVRAPTDFAYTRQHICDGLLLAMMVNSVRAPGLTLKTNRPTTSIRRQVRAQQRPGAPSRTFAKCPYRTRKGEQYGLQRNSSSIQPVVIFDELAISMGARSSNLAVRSPILYPALVESGRGLVVRTETLVCAKRLPQFWDERLLDMGEKGHPARPRSTSRVFPRTCRPPGNASR